MSDTMSDTMSDDYIEETNINTIIPDHNWCYLTVKPYPLTNIELNKGFFEDKNVIIFNKYIGPPCSGSGDQSECYFGKIMNENIYFYIMDDPGYSGYDCCGSINLYYSESLKIIKENMEFFRKK